MTNKNHKGFAVLLGRSWICSTNCQINLRTKEYTLEVNSVSLIGNDLEEDLPTKEKTSNQATSLSQAQSSKQRHPKQTQSYPPHNRVQGRGERQKLFYWRPKAATNQTPAPKPQAVPTAKVTQHPQRQPKAIWKWLPKDRPTKAKPVKSEA